MAYFVLVIKMKADRTSWDKRKIAKAGGFLTAFLAVFFYLGLCGANPDTASLQSALVWRTDALGDYVFVELPSPGVYEINPAHQASGRIETISASYQFTGAVTLEVSADNGYSYTPIINGARVTSGFGQGNQLKWRATLAEDSALTEVTLSYTDSVGVKGTFGEPRLSGFGLRKSLFINNASLEELFNYQVKILVAESAGAHLFDVHCEGNIQANFADVRFTGADGQTIYPHYLEKVEGFYPNRVATFWVKVPQIPVRGLALYLYFGNAQAPDLSSAEDVFDFFDDFAGEELDFSKWELKEGAYMVSGSELKLESAEIFSCDYLMQDGIIEYRARAELGDEVRVILRGETQDFLESQNQIAYSSSYSGAEHCLAVGDIVKANQAEEITSGTTYDYRAILEATKLTFQRYSEGYQELQVETAYDDAGGLTSGSLGLKAGADCINYFEWVRVRKYAEGEVGIDKEDAQAAVAEYVELPEFAGTQLNTEGNLILTDGVNQGNYTSRTLALPDEARILIPSWQAEDLEKGQIELAVSLDGGADFAADLAAQEYYYASSDDFSSGSELKFKAELNRLEGLGAQLKEMSADYGFGTVLLVSPNGGETYVPGAEQEITWTAQEYEESYKMKLEYSLDGGQAYQVITEETENDGAYLWTLPQDESQEALVRISDAREPEVYDVSDGVFSIAEAVVEEEPEEEVEEAEEEIEIEEPEEAGPRPGARLYELLIKVGDNVHPDPDVDARGSFKDGDIVVVKTAGFSWTTRERQEFVIVRVYLSEGEAEEIAKPKTILIKDETGRLVKKMIRRRARRINFAEFGLAAGYDKDAKINLMKELLKGKAVDAEEAIEEK